MKIIETEVLFHPESEELRFLPEGPYTAGPDLMSWVAIQHGAASSSGSINLLDTRTRQNRSFELPGRPGFAFPTTSAGVFVAGVERELGLFDTSNQSWTAFATEVDRNTTNTIINDGVIFEGNLVLGCKELEFKTKKAGLYLWRRSDRQLIQLRDDQICSNGKAIVRDDDGVLNLIDIDSPSKTITSSVLNIDAGILSEPRVIVDLSDEEVFPDGMIVTPDHKSLIVALYDPGDPHFGAARQYSLQEGQLETIWTCAGSPRVTCPQLIEHEGRVRLVLTSAVEHMPADQQKRHPQAGAIFVGDTSFETIGDQPLFELPL
ncbi:MAG: SMP-30/gluconolactonase/LRE family protein [Planctomycetaceae bacterium]